MDVAKMLDEWVTRNETHRAVQALRDLPEKGAFICGGFVRDCYFDLEPRDLDVYYAIPPVQTKNKMFQKLGVIPSLPAKWDYTRKSYLGGDKYLTDRGMSVDVWIEPSVDAYLHHVPLAIQQISVSLETNDCFGVEGFEKSIRDRTLYVNNFDTLYDYKNLEKAKKLAARLGFKFEPELGLEQPDPVQW